MQCCQFQRHPTGPVRGGGGGRQPGADRGGGLLLLGPVPAVAGGAGQRQETVRKPNARERAFAPQNGNDNWEVLRYRATDF